MFLMKILTKIYLKKISSTYVDVTTIKFQSLDEYWEINNKFENEFDYTVSWVDCIYNQNKSLRGVYLAGNHKENFERKKYFENIETIYEEKSIHSLKRLFCKGLRFN